MPANDTPLSFFKNENTYDKNKYRAEMIFRYPENKSVNLFDDGSVDIYNNSLNYLPLDYSQNNSVLIADSAQNAQNIQKLNHVYKPNKNLSANNNSDKSKSLTKIEQFKPNPLNFYHKTKNSLDDNIVKVAEKIIKQNDKRVEIEKNFGFEESAENLEMAKKSNYLSTPYAQKHKIYENVSQVDNSLRDKVSAKIVSQLGHYNLYKIKGIYYNSDSSASKKLASNLDVLYKVQQHAQELNEGKVVNDSLKFNDMNFYNAIGKADIINMSKNSSGEVELYITDIYDFNKNSSNPLVKAGYELQSEGYLIPYFVIYFVKIPSEIAVIYLN